ncbi:conserved hypothetical protein [Burkholderia cenocepacia HI2424]|uniref:Uncharacterized protein n=1 Tax=Burkholderia orbicola (strain AU 1054) TaxID=331271 RepID=A0A0H2XYD4_BURO1|nr:conserved hypothetical protein [Burkholderia cenocepacia HI2424]
MRAFSSQFVRRIDDEEDAQHRGARRHEVVCAARAAQRRGENTQTQSCPSKKQSCCHAPDRSGGLVDCVFHTAPVYSHDLNGIGKKRRVYLQSFHYNRNKIRKLLVLFPIKFRRSAS